MDMAHVPVRKIPPFTIVSDRGMGNLIELRRLLALEIERH